MRGSGGLGVPTSRAWFQFYTMTRESRKSGSQARYMGTLGPPEPPGHLGSLGLLELP